jgi:hypothetical protein
MAEDKAVRGKLEFDMKETIAREDALGTVIVPYGNPRGARGVSKKLYPRESIVHGESRDMRLPSFY